MHTCAQCKETKPDDEFYNSKSYCRGGSYTCKQCTRERQAVRRSQPAYNAYDNAKKRCKLPNHPAYQWYGARGISCDKETFATYKAFWDAYGHLYEQALLDYPGEKLTIDRIDNDGNYEPGNIRFVPNYVNQANRGDNCNITWKGETKIASEWAREFGISVSAFLQRYQSGWSMSLIKTVPINRQVSRAISAELKRVMNAKQE